MSVDGKRVVFVMGPPRTGASAIASSLHELGVDLGRSVNRVDTLPSMVASTGSFELVWVSEINDEIMRQLDASPTRPDLFSREMIGEARLEALRIKLYEAVKNEWPEDSSLIGIKDPRISLLFPVWESVLSSLGYECKCLISFRHPLGYMKSYGALVPGWSSQRLLLDWAGYILSSLYFAGGHDTKLVDYDAFASDPTAVVREIRNWLNLPPKREPQGAAAFDRSLYHHSYDGLEPSDAFVNELYNSLKASRTDTTRLNWHARGYESFLTAWPLVRAHIREKEAQIQKIGARLISEKQALEERLRSRDAQLEELSLEKEAAIHQLSLESEQTAERASERARLELNRTHQRLLEAQIEREEIGRLLATMLGQSDGALRVVRAELEEKTRDFMEREQSLSQRLGQANTELAAIHRSLAWKVLQVYGRIKYPYLMPFYNVYGRIKHRYLLPVFRRRRAAESKDGTPSQPAALEGAKVVRPEAEGQPGEPQSREASRFEFGASAIPEIPDALPMVPHTATVDIIICVHNALDELRECLDSVERCTTTPYSLIIVDDGSGRETQDFVTEFAASRGAHLICNPKARGYTLAANQGLRYSGADYVVLLNSDTIVAPGWLDRLIACAESDGAIGLVGPLSNAASWQSVPELFDRGQFASNGLPADLSVAEVGELAAQQSRRLYPRVGFLNGFCLTVKREVISSVGVFDEVHFGAGYGEENDYALRARQAGWELAIADDAYVYHHLSRSYSEDRRKELVRRADATLQQVHGETVVNRGVEQCRYDRTLEGIRARHQVLEERRKTIELGSARWGGKSVAFILPVYSCCGGANIALHEAEAMRRMGVNVAVINLERHREGFESGYPDNQVPVLYVDSENEIAGVLEDFDGALATYYLSVYWMERIASRSSRTALGYYIQDFEPFFFGAGSGEYKKAWESYTLYPELVRIAKTDWDRETIKNNIGVDSFVGGATVDIDLYRPRPRRDPDWPARPLRVLAMLRPETSRRAPLATLQTLSAIRDVHGDNIEIILFGCGTDSPEYLGLAAANPGMSSFRNAGMLNRKQVAWLMNEIDIFVDFSIFQAQGLTAMEAMCCGAAVIVPQIGGSMGFVQDGRNGTVVDTGSSRACVESLNALIFDHGRRVRLQRQAIFDICKFFPEKGAYRTLEALFSATAKAGTA